MKYTKHPLSLAKRAITLYRNANVPKKVWRHNAREWIKKINYLGNKWILAQEVQRRA